MTDIFRSFRLPNSLNEKAVERIEKFDDQTVIIKKVLVLADETEAVVSSSKMTLAAINSEIEAAQTAIANYQDQAWIAERVAELQAKQDAAQAKKDLLLN